MATSSPTKKLLIITGSSGLIGTRLQQELSGTYQVLGLDVKPSPQPVPGTEWLECDLTQDASVNETLAQVASKYGRQIASVIHLAAYYDFSGEPSPLYDELTVQGTRRLIDGLQDFQVEQFVFSSSLLVMKPADDPDHRLTESDATQAEWDYPRSKLQAEAVLHEHRGRIPIVILRIAGVYDEECHSLPISQQMRRIYEKQFESFVFPGDASHGQPFIHLDDLVACLRRVIMLQRELAMWETFLIAEPEVMGYAELQEQLGQLIHGKQWPTVRVPKPVAKAGAWIKDQLPGNESFIKPWMVDRADEHYPVVIRRARERLRWTPTHRLSHSLKDMANALKDHPQAWYESNHLPWPDEQQTERSARV